MIGLLPVIGVPLPLVSAGGSALVTTLLALGMLLSFARNEPGARARPRGPSGRRPPVARGAAESQEALIVAPLTRALVGAPGRWRLGRSRVPAAGPRRLPCAAATPRWRVTALGTETGLEARLVPARGYDLRYVPRVPLPAASRPGDCSGCPAHSAARRARPRAGAIDETGAEVVVGFGGYVSTPAYLAARQRRIPIVVHEQNARAGLANRVGARMTAVRRDDVPRHGAAARLGASGCRCAGRSPRSTGRRAAPRG